MSFLLYEVNFSLKFNFQMNLRIHHFVLISFSDFYATSWLSSKNCQQLYFLLHCSVCEFSITRSAAMFELVSLVSFAHPHPFLKKNLEWSVIIIIIIIRVNIDLLRSAKELPRVRETAGKEQRNKKIIVKIKLGTIKYTNFSFFSFKTKAYYIAQAELEFIILLPQLSKCWITAMKWQLANT